MCGRLWAPRFVGSVSKATHVLCIAAAVVRTHGTRVLLSKSRHTRGNAALTDLPFFVPPSPMYYVCSIPRCFSGFSPRRRLPNHTTTVVGRLRQREEGLPSICSSWYAADARHMPVVPFTLRLSHLSNYQSGGTCQYPEKIGENA